MDATPTGTKPCENETGKQKGEFVAPDGGLMQLKLQPVGARFRLLEPFAYRTPRYREQFVVPADVDTFETDLASIPWFFAWLVPGLGTHLAAVLLHDGLVMRKGEARTYDGPKVDRKEADRILRDAMGDLGTPLIRRWLMWAGVILATCFSDLPPRWRWRAVVLATVLTVVVLGSVATLDLLDLWDVLPWMGARSWPVEVVGGGVFALLIPLVLAVAWWHLWAAGAITGIALAFLLHVTVLVLFLSGVYWAAEKAVAIATRKDEGPNVKHNLEVTNANQGGAVGHTAS